VSWGTVLLKDIKLAFAIPGMLCRRGQRGLEAKNFGLSLGLVASGLGLGLGLMQCWPRSDEGCRHGLVVTAVVEITSFTLRSSLIGNCCLLYNILVKL